MDSTFTAQEVVNQLKNLSQQELVLPVLVQLMVVMIVAPLFAQLARWLKQPAPVGWIAAGIILGPSVLGKYAPEVSRWIFHLEQVGYAPAVTNMILPHVFFVVAEIGLVLLLFITGVEFDFSHLKSKGRAASVISIAGIAVPFILGLLIAPIIRQHTAPNIPALGFSLFLGTSMSITALPILGKLMMELGISRTRLGTITISAGASDDAVGWVLLAVVAAIVRSQLNLLHLAVTLVSALAFLGMMLGLIRPVICRMMRNHLQQNEGKLGRNALAYLLVFVVGCGIVTHQIGIFALFGAFLAGAILSEVEGLREQIKAKLQDVVEVVFLPVFFTYTGLHTDIGTFTTLTDWALCGLILCAAVLGKLGGCSIAARMCGYSTRESLCIGTMMNCRALMELIAINIGYKLGVIPDSVYTMMVLMALITTVMTTPTLLWWSKGTELEEPIKGSGFLSAPQEKVGVPTSSLVTTECQ